MNLTAMNLVNAIANLPKNRQFDYVNGRNAGKIVIDSITQPEGPIRIKRFNPTKGETLKAARTESISSQMIWRLANAIQEDSPINLDRVFGASYNTRSVIESLLAHTPLFYWCKLDRLEVINTKQTITKGHKHLIYLPNSPHENGILSEYKTNIVISEMKTEVIYQSVDLDTIRAVDGLSIEEKRRHAQIQIALVKIGNYLGYRTWVAANDRGLKYNGKAIAQMDGVIDSLSNEKVLSSYSEAINGAKLIDCIWFRNGKLMPAVMEIEHSTGIISGLTRMKNFCDYAPRLQDIRWTIVAPDEYRAKVIEFANRPQFRELDAKFFPYSAVEELYSLCERRKPKGITDQFLDSFMENCVTH
ncbi:restriction endonuclease [Proteus sp. DFP240708]|uniref:restriction endonuclease n=1 Tax=Proteus TaxID=583 RepID=UPI001E2CCA61|nr:MULTISPECIES: restriction endonuclease [Proteus]